MVRGQADHIGGLESAFLLQSLYLVCVGFQNLFLGGRSRQFPGWPLLKAHTLTGQRVPNHLRVGGHGVGGSRLVLVEDAQGGHGRTLMVSSSHSRSEERRVGKECRSGWWRE